MRISDWSSDVCSSDLTTGPDGVDREKLGAAVFGNKGELQALEQIVHPAVRTARENFLRQHRARPMVVLDIPLLLEKGVPQGLAGVIVVSAHAWKQRQRVLRRPGLTHAKSGRHNKLQAPDEEKKRSADKKITKRPT